jgi:hypothetical protein
LGNPKQSDQELSGDSPRRRGCRQNLGQEHRGAKREDHTEQVASGGSGLFKSPYGIDKSTQRDFSDNRYLFREQDTIFLVTQPKDMLHGS